jgi:hypothetical protein
VVLAILVVQAAQQELRAVALAALDLTVQAVVAAAVAIAAVRQALVG